MHGGVALAVLAATMLGGCVVKTVADVATAPVKVAGKAVDWTTTSRSEADRNRGRALRRREERLGRLERAYRDSDAACRRGDPAACDRARAQYAEISAIAPTVPAQPR